MRPIFFGLLGIGSFSRPVSVQQAVVVFAAFLHRTETFIIFLKGHLLARVECPNVRQPSQSFNFLPLLALSPVESDWNTPHSLKA
jgi:hypothetical protein